MRASTDEEDTREEWLARRKRKQTIIYITDNLMSFATTDYGSHEQRRKEARREAERIFKNLERRL